MASRNLCGFCKFPVLKNLRLWNGVAEKINGFFYSKRLKVRQKASCFHISITNLAPYITSFIFCKLYCVCNNSMHVWSDHVRQPYHRLHFWHTFKFASDYLLCKLMNNMERWNYLNTGVYWSCFTHSWGMCWSKRCMPTAASPTWIPQHGLGC